MGDRAILDSPTHEPPTIEGRGDDTPEVNRAPARRVRRRHATGHRALPGARAAGHHRRHRIDGRDHRGHHQPAGRQTGLSAGPLPEFGLLVRRAAFGHRDQRTNATWRRWTGRLVMSVRVGVGGCECTIQDPARRPPPRLPLGGKPTPLRCTPPVLTAKFIGPSAPLGGLRSMDTFTARPGTQPRSTQSKTRRTR